MTLPYISYEPGKQGGQACLSQTRMTVECVVWQYWEGMSLEKMLAQQWPIQKRNELILCAWFAARHWRLPWRKRWGKWLRRWEYQLWYGEWDAVELPPQKGNPNG